MNRPRYWHPLLTALTGLLLSPLALAQSGQITDGTWTLQELRDTTGMERFGGLEMCGGQLTLVTRDGSRIEFQRPVN